jgi:hypothetical protein
LRWPYELSAERASGDICSDKDDQYNEPKHKSERQLVAEELEFFLFVNPTYLVLPKELVMRIPITK